MRTNYPLNNDSQSYDAANQFMPNQSSTSNESKKSPDDMQQMFLMFQKMATDPALFMKIMSSVKPPEPELEIRKRDFIVEQHKYRNHQASPKRTQTDYPIASKQSRKKGSDVIGRFQQNDVLAKYCPGESKISDSSDFPNKSQIIQKVIENNISTNVKQSQLIRKKSDQSKVEQQVAPYRYSPDDDRPIKPVKGYSYEPDANQSTLLKNSLLQPVDPQKYYEVQNRPIKGIKGDFKAHVMKEQGLPMNEFPQEQSQQNNQSSSISRPKTFLKKGSRQHLSSAAEKSNNKIKTKQHTPKAEMDLSTSFVNESEKPDRQIYQNRVLGRKSVSAKSISKRASKQKQQEEKKKIQHSNTTTNYNTQNQGSRTPRAMQRNDQQRRDTSTSPTFQKQHPPQQQKAKKQTKKNIFQDSSSENEESNLKHSNLCSTMNKTQVITGVFLTKKQLHQILSKHGKSPSTTSASESDLQQLKSKYIDMCNILTEQRQVFEAQMLNQKEQFESYKQAEIAKIKNQRKVQERNLMTTQKTKEKEKDKEDFEALKKIIEKERQDYRHKEKNYKLMIDKYKKLAEDKQKCAEVQKQVVREQIVKVEDKNTSNNRKKTTKAVVSGEVEQIGNNSSKGVEQNNGYNNNKKEDLKDSLFVKQKQKLPSYQDLKKSTLNKPAVDNYQQKNKKYEYYEQFDHKETLKEKSKLPKFAGVSDDQELSQKSQKNEEQIVEYNPSMKLSDLCKIPLSIKMVSDEMIEGLFHCLNNPEYKKYVQLNKKQRTKIHSSRNAADRKVTNVYADGGKQIIFDTGVRKQYFSNGYVIIFFANGDIKQKLSDDTVLYFYRQKQVDQITLPNKINLYRFSNNQVEFHYEDKSVEIRHPDGTFNIM